MWHSRGWVHSAVHVAVRQVWGPGTRPTMRHANLFAGPSTQRGQLHCAHVILGGLQMSPRRWMLALFVKLSAANCNSLSSPIQASLSACMNIFEPISRAHSVGAFPQIRAMHFMQVPPERYRGIQDLSWCIRADHSFKVRQPFFDLLNV